MKTSEIRVVPYIGAGAKGPDTCYAVDMYDNGVLVQTKLLPNKTIDTVKKFCTQWDKGEIDENK